MSTELHINFTPQGVSVDANESSANINMGRAERYPTPGPQGEPGFSPTVTVTDITGGHRVTITDEDGAHIFDVMNGETGRTPEIFATATTLPAGSVATANISGTIEQPLLTIGVPRGADGQNGQNGTNGTNGTDGVSPDVTITAITGGHEVTITDADHPTGQSFNVMDGQNGQNGTNGTNGTDGVSPEVTIGSITGGHSVTITDKEHPTGQTFNVMDGATGPTGPGVPNGGTTDQMLVKNSGTDQDTKWSSNAYRASSIPMGKLDGTSTATVMTATVDGITELRDGVCVWLTNGVITSASGYTININNLGAKPVYSSQSAASRTTTIFASGYTALLIYNSTRTEGGCWDYVYGYDSNTNTIGYQLRTNSYSLPMTSIVYRYRLLFQSADNAHWVPANNSTSTNATASRTVCQDKINPFGSIVYYGTTASVSAGSRPAVANLWQQYGITLGYSFNRTGAALTLTSWKPVYVKCAPQTDGSAIIDSTTPYVQDLPTTEDGKIYIFIGVAYSATSVELTLNHPVYWYKDGAIRPYTNAPSSGGGGTGNVVAIGTLNKTKSEESGYEYFFDLDKTASEIFPAYAAGSTIRVLLYSNWGKSSNDEWVQLDSLTFCKGLTFNDTYSNYLDMLQCNDADQSGSSFLGKVSDQSTATQIETTANYLPISDS